MSEVIVIQESIEIVEVSTPGVPGPAGVGVPPGGTTDQRLVKASNADFDTEWVTPTMADAAPPDATYLVTTADPELTSEVVVGTTPGGELGGTWASPTVDATHSGSSHADVQSAAEATAAAALAAHLLVDVVDGDAAGGVLSGTYPNPSFAVDMATQAELDSTQSELDAHHTRHEDGGADEISIAGLSGTPAALQAHLDDTSDAHDASAISSVAAGNLASTDVQAALNELDTEKQPIDSDLTAIAALAPTNDDVVQRKAGAWTNRSIAQILVDLAAAGTTFQPLDSDLTALAGLAIAADTLPYGSGSHTMALATFTSFARTLLDDADASTALSTLGVSTFIKTLLDDADAAAARATLGAAPVAAKYIVQTADSELSAEQSLGALATGLLKNANTTGVLSIATEGTDYYKPGGTDVALADGGTGASLTDPNADRIMFWDDSAGAVTWLTPGTGLTITATTIDASGGGGGSAADDESLIIHMEVYA